MGFPKSIEIEVFEKHTSANHFQIEREKSYNYLLIIYLKRVPVYECMFVWVMRGNLNFVTSSVKSAITEEVPLCTLAKQTQLWTLSFGLCASRHQNNEIVIARNYKFLHGITHFCTELQSNCTALDQSESSNFFMYMIMLEMKN